MFVAGLALYLSLLRSEAFVVLHVVFVGMVLVMVLNPVSLLVIYHGLRARREAREDPVADGSIVWLSTRDPDATVTTAVDDIRWVDG